MALVELYRVATAAIPFFCSTEVLDSDRKATFAERVDAILSAGCLKVGGLCRVMPCMEAAVIHNGSVHVTSDVP